MATFPNISPSYGATKTSEPKVNSVQFGSGYEQRVIFGINQNPKVWDLAWDNITEADSDTIEEFLDARAGQESFDWTPPLESSSYKWVCQQWTKKIDFEGLATITATFRQVFEA